MSHEVWFNPFFSCSTTFTSFFFSHFCDWWHPRGQWTAISQPVVTISIFIIPSTHIFYFFLFSSTTLSLFSGYFSFWRKCTFLKYFIYFYFDISFYSIPNLYPLLHIWHLQTGIWKMFFFSKQNDYHDCDIDF